MRRPWLFLAIALLVVTAVFLATQSDMIAADPLWYAQLAHQLAVDPAGLFATHDTHPFVMRLGLTVPLSLLYRAFGVSPLVTNLPSLGSEFLLVIVVYAAAQTPRAKAIAMIACVTCVPMIVESNRLGADLPSAALMGCSIMFLSRRDRHRGGWWLAAAVVTWMLAFLVKESAVWCAPVWVYAIICDVRATTWRAVMRAFVPAVVVGLVLAASYLVLCAVLWGDPLARFKGIEGAVASVHGVASYGPAWSVTLARMTWQVPRTVISMFGVMLVPVVFSPWLVRGRDRIWWVALATMVLLYWFGSSSTVTYLPLPISKRLIVPALPFVLVVASLATDAALDIGWLRRWRASAALVMLIAIMVPWQDTIRTLRRHGQPETATFATLRDEIESDPTQRTVLVCGEPRCVAVTGFYFGFAPPPSFTVMTASDFAHAPRPEGVTVRALINRGRGRGIRMTDPALDATREIDAIGLVPIASHAEIQLDDAGDGARLWRALQR